MLVFYINVQQLFYFPVCLEFNRQNLFMIMGSSTVTTTVPSIPADPLIKFWMFLRLFLSSKRPGQIVSYLKCTPLLDDFLTLKWFISNNSLNPLSDDRLLAREKIYTPKRWEFLCNFTAKNDKISCCDPKGYSLDFLFLQHCEFWEHLVKLFFFSSLNYCNSLF